MTPDTKFNATISGHVYAQPLFWKPKSAKRGLVVVATESNNVYALDEANGKVVWQNLIGNAMPLSQLPCGNIDPMGITGTPVIDPATGTLYFDAMTKTSNGARHMVHALSLTDGSELSGWPLDMQAAIGGGWDSSVQGERSGLLFFKGTLYVVYGGHFGDCGSYRGTVAQIDPATHAVDRQLADARHRRRHLGARRHRGRRRLALRHHRQHLRHQQLEGRRGDHPSEARPRAFHRHTRLLHAVELA